MADALSAGARGIEPAAADVPVDATTDATRVVGGAAVAGAAGAAAGAAAGTAATNVVRGSDAVPDAGREPRGPREPRARSAAPVPAAAPARVPGRTDRATAPARRSRANRAVRVFVLLLVLVGVGAAAGIVVSSQLDNNPQLRRVIYDDVDQAVDELKGFIDDNTR